MKHLSTENGKLKAEIMALTKQNDQKKAKIEELEAQLAMSGDSVGVIQNLQV